MELVTVISHVSPGPRLFPFAASAGIANSILAHLRAPRRSVSATGAPQRKQSRGRIEPASGGLPPRIFPTPARRQFRVAEARNAVGAFKFGDGASSSPRRDPTLPPSCNFYRDYIVRASNNCYYLASKFTRSLLSRVSIKTIVSFLNSELLN